MAQDDDTLPTIGDLVAEGRALLYDDTPDVTTYLIRDGDKIHIRKEWKNIQALLDYNAAEAAEFNATGRLPDWTKVASIPIGFYYDLQAQGITNDPERMKRILNDGDYARFRVNNLRV